MRIDPVDYPLNWKAIRKVVLKRDGFKCRNCGNLEHPSNLEVDHIRPLSDGGRHDLNNLQTLCRDCHTSRHPHLMAKAARERGRHMEPDFLRWQHLQYERERRLRRLDWRKPEKPEPVMVGVHLPWRATLVKILFWVLVLALGAFCVYSLLR